MEGHSTICKRMRDTCAESAHGLVKDFIDPRTAVLKTTYFTIIAGVVILWVQLSPFQSTLGLTMADTGVISMVGSVMIIMGPVTFGVLADIVGNYKYLLASACFLEGLVALGFTFLPGQVNSGNSQSKLWALPTNWTLVPFDSDIDSSISKDGSDLGSSGYNISNSSLPDLAAEARQREISTDNPTFWSYLFLHAFFMLLNSATVSLFDSTVLVATQEKGVDYGFQRCYGTLAAIISSLVGGMAVDHYSQGLPSKDFSIIFYISCALHLASACQMLFLDTSNRLPAACCDFQSIVKILTRPKMVILYGTTLVAGVFVGYGETFMYRYLSEMGASSSLLGATVTVGGVVEFFLMLTATFLVTASGVYSIMTLGYLCFSIRFLAMYLITDPQLVLLIEVLDSVSTGLFFTVAVMHLSTLVPTDSLPSYRGLLGTAYMGIGKLLGASVGTGLVSLVSTRDSWAVMSGVAFIVCLLMGLAMLCQDFTPGRTIDITPSDFLQQGARTSRSTGCSGAGRTNGAGSAGGAGGAGKNSAHTGDNEAYVSDTPETGAANANNNKDGVVCTKVNNLKSEDNSYTAEALQEIKKDVSQFSTGLANDEHKNK